MGKKSKAHRKKPPVATAAGATATATATAAVVATAATTATANKTRRGEFPESTYLVKAVAFRKKGNHAKAHKIYLQGIEKGCVHCLDRHTMKILLDGAAIENVNVREFWKDNKNLHLALPLLLEGAIRGNQEAIVNVCRAYDQVQHEENCFGDIYPAEPLTRYWTKHDLKSYSREDNSKTKQKNAEIKEYFGTHCSVCEIDSETVTLMKCDGCKFYYYCSKECQKKMWVEGQHAGVCRQLGILQQYHKPFAKKIWTDIAVHGIPPKDILELQDLRQRLGLSRPQAEYQDLLDAAKARRLVSTKLMIPRKDGTVQNGSFPRPI